MAIRRAVATLLLLMGLLMLSSAGSQAHFILNLNVRIIHVQHVNDGLRLYIRLPMPYLVADQLGDAPDGELPSPAPFTTNRFEADNLVHFVDFEAVGNDPEGLALLVAQGHRIVATDRELIPQINALRVHSVGTQPGFATLTEAMAAMAQEPIKRPRDTVFVGDTVVDVELFYPANTAVSSYALSSNLDPGLPGQENTANLILDYGPGDPQVFRSRGLMKEPVEVTRSRWDAALTFIWEGARHILEGIDHVLFVICLVISATTFTALLSRVTGFTIGHSVTLTMGFFGFVPSAAWFVPAIETGIALSIIYAAALAIWPRIAGASSNVQMLVITAAIGLLHGLGFSFVLQKILQVDAPNIWQSLLAFNIGVEIGQVAIVLLVWPTLLLFKRVNVQLWNVTRIGLAAGCTLVASIWTVERVGQVLATL